MTYLKQNYEEVKVTYLDASSPYLKDVGNGYYEIVKFKKGGDGYLIITMENVIITKSTKSNSFKLKFETIAGVMHKPGGQTKVLTNNEVIEMLK